MSVENRDAPAAEETVPAGEPLAGGEPITLETNNWNEAPQTVWSSAGLAASKTVYTTCYYLSFGVVFPMVLLVSLIPKNNALVHGLSDGAAAAKDAVEKWSAKRAGLKVETAPLALEMAPEPA